MHHSVDDTGSTTYISMHVVLSDLIGDLKIFHCQSGLVGQRRVRIQAWEIGQIGVQKSKIGIQPYTIYSFIDYIPMVVGLYILIMFAGTDSTK